jgi:hypothetical protein
MKCLLSGLGLGRLAGRIWGSSLRGVGSPLLAAVIGCVVVAQPSLSSAADCTRPPTGLVGWWTADGNARDWSGTNHGTLKGGAVATAAGTVGSAFSFDGTNGYVQIPDSAALRPTNFTIEGWVQFTSLNSGGLGASPAGQQYIVFKQNTRSSWFEGFYLGKERRSNGDIFAFAVSSAQGVSAEVDSTTPLATGTWYHVAAVRGTNLLQLYVNGQLVGQTRVTFAQNYGTLPLYFGTSGQSYWDHKLRGLLDEVTLYNRALSSSEIAAIYASGSAGKCKSAGAPVVSTQPQSQTVATGGLALFSVSASGTTPFSYQWWFNGAPLFGGTNTNFGLTNVQPANAGNYQVVITNTVGSVTSDVAVLTVTAAPVAPQISGQPTGQTVNVGSAVRLSVTATGTTPLSFQWQKNGSGLANGNGLSGATTSALSIQSAQLTDAGDYRVVVTNSAGGVTSGTATLIVQAPPAISVQPAGQTVAIGGTAIFSVTASGVPTPAYRWLFNGVSLAEGGQFTGTATPTLSVANVQSANVGNYSVVVANVAGAVTSSVAVLTLPGSCLAPPSGLVGWWPGDGSAGDIVGSHNGTLQGGASANAAGLVGGAFSFDGTNGYVSIADSSTFHLSTLTVEAWVWFDAYQSPGTSAYPYQQYIVFKQNSQNYEFEGFALTKDQDPQGDVILWEVASPSHELIRIDSVNTVKTGAWYHVAGVRGTDYVQLYLNGHLEAQTNVSFAQDYGNLPLYFGTSGQSFYDRRLHGRLDEVSLYNRALSAAEIGAIYAAGSGGKCKALNSQSIQALVARADGTDLGVRLSSAYLRGRQIHVSFESEAGVLYQVESSPDLQNWSEQHVISGTGGRTEWIGPLDSARQFYRVRTVVSR